MIPYVVTSGVIVLGVFVFISGLQLYTINVLVFHIMSNFDYYIKLILYLNSTVAIKRHKCFCNEIKYTGFINLNTYKKGSNKNMM